MRKLWTVTVYLKTEQPATWDNPGSEFSVAVKCDTGPQARNMVANRYPVQATKETRPYNAQTDKELPRVGF